MPVSRWPPRTDSGSSSLQRARKCGLKSNKSSCEGAPAWVSQMTRLARGAKCGSSGLSEPDAPNSFGFKSQASAATPMPVAVRPKKWRRVTCIGSNGVSSRFIGSFFGDGLIEVQQRAGHGGVGGKLHGIEHRISLRLADSEQTLRARTVPAETSLHPAPAGDEHSQFVAAWFAAGG